MARTRRTTRKTRRTTSKKSNRNAGCLCRRKPKKSTPKKKQTVKRTPRRKRTPTSPLTTGTPGKRTYSPVRKVGGSKKKSASR